MPVVETSTDPLPPILVVIMDEALEPDVTVAPAGLVRLTAINRGERPHDLVIARTDAPLDALARSDGAVRLDGLDVAGVVGPMGPGEQGDAEVDLIPGRYAVFANAVGDYDRGLRVELTVQPPEPFDAETGNATAAEESGHERGPATRL